MDAVAAADEGNKVARLKSVLIHVVFDRFHRIGKVERIVPALPRFDQRHQDIEVIALGRAAFAVIKFSISFSARR